MRGARQTASLASQPGESYENYLADEMLRSAVERQFGIIGEAFVGLRRIAPEVAAQLPDLSEAIAFRNIIVHDYTNIDHEVVWRIIRNDLSRLWAMPGQLLKDAPPV